MSDHATAKSESDTGTATVAEAAERFESSLPFGGRDSGAGIDDQQVDAGTDHSSLDPNRGARWRLGHRIGHQIGDRPL